MLNGGISNTALVRTRAAGLIVVLMMIIQQIDVLFQSIKSIFGL